MVWYHDYTMDQYKKWLRKSYNYNYGISEDKIYNYCVNTSTFQQRLAHYGLSASWVKSTMIPRLKNAFGNQGYVVIMLKMVFEGFNGLYDWINHTSSTGSGLGDLDQAINYTKQVYAATYPIAASDPNPAAPLPRFPNADACQTFYNSLPKKTVGAAYMPLTMAGNAWVWSPEWSQNYLKDNRGNVYGNPYDQIMNAIKSMGGDPLGSGGSSSNAGGGETGAKPNDPKNPGYTMGDGSTGDNPYVGGGGSGDGQEYFPSNNQESADYNALPSDPETLKEMLANAMQAGAQQAIEKMKELFPKAVYLNNSKFAVLFVTFRRYKEWLYIRYPWEDPKLNLLDFVTGESSITDFYGSGDPDSSGINKDSDGNNKPSDYANNENWYKNIVSQLDKIRDKKFTYVNIRPQPALTATNQADCSGFVGWIASKSFPKLYNNGFTNTGTQLAYFNSYGKVAWSGTQTQLGKNLNVVKDGDFLIMGSEPSCGASLNSHIAWVEDSEHVWSMEPAGLLCRSLEYFIKTWWTYKPYMNVCRPR